MSIRRFWSVATTALLMFFIMCLPSVAQTLESQETSTQTLDLTLRDENTTTTTVSPHLLLGNPSGAIHSLDQPDNYLIVRPQYALSYNRDRGIPNWVEWQLNDSWLGSLPRPSFEPDTSLPDDWERITPDDYTGSGFDRGHILPAADRNKTEEDSDAVFLMTNIIPQAPDNNQGPWEKLESYSRDLARSGKELYVVAGSSGIGGIGKYGEKTTIADGKVTVPARTWKIIVVLDQPGEGLGGITENTRVIAVDLPNEQGIKQENWTSYRTSVDQLEELTGYNFLSNLPTDIQDVIEAKIDNVTVISSNHRLKKNQD